MYYTLLPTIPEHSCHGHRGKVNIHILLSIRVDLVALKNSITHAKKRRILKNSCTCLQRFSSDLRGYAQFGSIPTWSKVACMFHKQSMSYY